MRIEEFMALVIKYVPNDFNGFKLVLSAEEILFYDETTGMSAAKEFEEHFLSPHDCYSYRCTKKNGVFELIGSFDDDFKFVEDCPFNRWADKVTFNKNFIVADNKLVLIPMDDSHKLVGRSGYKVWDIEKVILTSSCAIHYNSNGNDFLHYLGKPEMYGSSRDKEIPLCRPLKLPIGKLVAVRGDVALLETFGRTSKDMAKRDLKVIYDFSKNKILYSTPAVNRIEDREGKFRALSATGVVVFEV
jgi:hypothetical protein